MSAAIFHSAAIEVDVDADVAFDYMSDGLRQGEWTLGSLEREHLGDGLFRGTSIFDGRHTYVRIHADRARLLVDYEVGRDPQQLLWVNTARIVAGPRVGRSPSGCVVALSKWRAPSESDDDWRRSTLTFSTEVYIIKGRLERASGSVAEQDRRSSR